MQDVVNSGIQCVVLRTGATNVEESSAAQSGISLGIQGSKPSNATISKSQVLGGPCTLSCHVTASALPAMILQDALLQEKFLDHTPSLGDAATVFASTC